MDLFLLPRPQPVCLLIIHYPLITTGLVGVPNVSGLSGLRTFVLPFHHGDTLASFFTWLTLSPLRLDIISSERLLPNSPSKSDLPVIVSHRT